MFKIKIASICLALAASQTVAEPDRISILLGSKHYGIENRSTTVNSPVGDMHFDFTQRFNERNLGVFLTWEGDVLDWNVGVYKNSYARTSVAATVSLPIVEWEGGSLDAFAGLAHYPIDGRTFALSVGDIVPVAGVQVRQGNLFAQIMPSDGENVDYIAAFGLTFDLK